MLINSLEHTDEQSNNVIKLSFGIFEEFNLIFVRTKPTNAKNIINAINLKRFMKRIKWKSPYGEKRQAIIVVNVDIYEL